MRRRNIGVLVAFVTLFVLVSAEVPEPLTDVTNPPAEDASVTLETHCYDAPSRKSKFTDPKYYWKLLVDIFKQNSVRPEESVQFYLYTKASRDCGEEIRVHDDSLLRSGFNASHPTRILIHGWMSHSNAEFCRSVRDAYLKIGDFNVIDVDWSTVSITTNYYKAVKLVETIGEFVADFAKHLRSSMGVEYDSIYLIGHSVGAHIAGSAGKRIQPEKFNTIFALDPAGPGFEGKPADSVIDATDAKYVESIQTSNSLGIGQPVGHATFFPNKGIYQGCLVYGCAHRRSYQYFAESLFTRRGFWGTHCYKKSFWWSCPEEGTEYRMGGEPSKPKNGTFFVRTESSPPFALGKMGKYLYA